jgi:hypothetical protein
MRFHTSGGKLAKNTYKVISVSNIPYIANVLSHTLSASNPAFLLRFIVVGSWAVSFAGRYHAT